MTNPVWSRFRPVLFVAAALIGLSFLTRLALLIAARHGVPSDIGSWLYVFGMGLVYDLATLSYVAWPFLLLLWLLPQRVYTHRVGAILVGTLGFATLLVLVVVAGAEWTFWDEFQTRFNFIAVDYLVYTNEVIGNIRESYPMGKILAGILLVTVALFFSGRRWLRPRDAGSSFGARSAFVGAWLLGTVLVTALLDGDAKERTANEYVNQLAGNGIFEFFAAARASELSYARFYRNVPDAEAFGHLRQLLKTPDSSFVSDDPMDITRDIHNAGPEKKLNVVLISVESLSAYFSGSYGGNPSLTPELDRLTDQSLLFTRLIASGTRTVRGLEALALSVPPTPGESIVKRPKNENLFSMATVFNAKGYVSEFLYGGYGAFDNMNYFFANNGYEVHDRSEILSDKIHSANIWGVADEDLYGLALDQFDRIHAQGKPFFAHIMTTSNHRPYTFPAGRVRAPQGKRSSTVRYTDWAIGDLLRRAREKPWFDDTVFIITADHCAASGGIASLPVFRYQIPLWIYSPKHIAPGRVDRLISQIDIAPTVLGLLGMSYRSRFYGYDIAQLEPGRERAFIGNYQLLGYLRDDQLVQLAPRQGVTTVKPDYVKNTAQPELPANAALIDDATAYYQTASYLFSNGKMTQTSAPAATMAAK